jgi:hypothetical protein
MFVLSIVSGEPWERCDTSGGNCANIRPLLDEGRRRAFLRREELAVPAALGVRPVGDAQAHHQARVRLERDLPRGRSEGNLHLRIAFSVNQAGAGYLGGTSRTIIYHRS